MVRNLLSEKEAAAYIGISVSTLKRKRYSGEVTYYRIGNRILYSPDKHLDLFLRQCEQNSELRDLGLNP
jgi:excisionase family DNA binding protein